MSLPAGGVTERTPAPEQAFGTGLAGELRAMLAEACDRLIAAPASVVGTSVSFHLPTRTEPVPIIAAAEEISAERDCDHLVHVRGDLYEVRFTRRHRPLSS